MADVLPRKSEIKDEDVAIKLKFDMKTHKSIAAKRIGGKSFGCPCYMRQLYHQKRHKKLVLYDSHDLF